MMDIIMVVSLVIGFMSIKIFANWCGKQIEKK